MVLKYVLLVIALVTITVSIGFSVSGQSSADTPIRVIVYSPDGTTSLQSDYQYIYVTHDGVMKTLEVAGIVGFNFINNRTAFMNRGDYGLLLIDTKTYQIMWLDYNYPAGLLAEKNDDYCSPCNIGGGGTDFPPMTVTPEPPTAVPTKG